MGKLVWIGAALLAVAVGVGFFPLSSNEVGCGSVLRAEASTEVAMKGGLETMRSCADLRSTVRVPMILLAGGGAITVLVGLRRRSDADTDASPSTIAA